MKTLIVVDMQNDFVTGDLGSKEAERIVPNIKEKVKYYLENDCQVIFTRDTHYDNYLDTHEGKILPVKHCIKDTEGWEIAPGLEIKGCKYIDKETFGWPDWNSLILGDIELVGVCTDICVVSNALILRAQFPECEITVDASCCAGTNVANHNAALLTMRSCQINVEGNEI